MIKILHETFLLRIEPIEQRDIEGGHHEKGVE
jgi:hypothetical protein